MVPNQNDNQFTTWLSYILLCRARSSTNEGYKTNLWTYDLYPVAIMSFSLHSCLHHWSHSWTCIWRSVPPCSRQITTLILISKDFAWIRVVEQQWGEIPSCLQNNSLLGGKPHSRGVSKGWRPKIFPGF